MEPLTIVTILGKIFATGALTYLGTRESGFAEVDVNAIAAGLEALTQIHGAATTKPSPKIAALHTALVTQAFGMAFRDHWAHNDDFAPKFDDDGWLHRVFRSKEQAARKDEMLTRLRLALQWLLPEKTQQAQKERVLEMYQLHPDPLITPVYKALYMAFADGGFDNDEATALLDMRRDGARLQFEGVFQMAYAELLVTPRGQELAQYLFGVEQDRPRQFRRRLLEEWSLSDRRHVFGVATPGIPMMPLRQMYVEPEGVWNKEAKPIRQWIKDLLGQHKIVFVCGDFGQGKSLTARMLTCEWARDHIQSFDKPSRDLPLPILIRCARDFQKESFESTVREALQHQAEAMGIELQRSDDVFARPPDTMRVVYFVDGLDEVTLTHAEQETFFRELRAATSANHRAVVLSRKAALPPEEKLGGAPVVHVKPFDEAQIGMWLSRWNEVARRNTLIDMAQVRQSGLFELARTPILLFMIATTWDLTSTEEGKPSQAAIYEHFFKQIATGKSRHDHDRHPRVAEASEKLKEKLIQRKFVGEHVSVQDAMLWLMSRIAWEYRRCATQGEVLDLQDVDQLLRSELDLKKDKQAHEMIRMGALVVLQADLQDQNHTILFGHKSFLEFLTARWWADRLRAIVKSTDTSKQRKLERDLYGAMLISLNPDDRTFDFLMEILNGVSWKGEERANLADWAEKTFQDERFVCDKEEGEDRSWGDDLRPRLRHAALGIRCCLVGAEPLRIETEPLRSLIAWFWARSEFVRIVAPHVNLEDGSLEGAFLPHAILGRANLKGAYLLGANLKNANIEDANLKAAVLERANLDYANLNGANLNGANLIGANLIDAKLHRAHLVGVYLSGANLNGANLKGANLNGARLRGANLNHANVSGAQLSESFYDNSTVWPAGFRPEEAGAINVDPHRQ